METKDYEASMLQPKKVTITNTTDCEFDLQMYKVNLHLLVGGRSTKYPDGQEVDFIIESSEDYVYYESIIENLGDEWKLDDDHKISIAFEDAGGGGSAVLIEKTVTENGVYNASSDEADGYSSVNVEVEPSLTTKNITENDTYIAADDGVDGYSSVTVNVPAPVSTMNTELILEDPESPSSMPDYFNGNIQRFIKSIELPTTLQTIAEYAFSETNALTSIEFPSSVTTIGSYAFFNSGLTNITIPGTVTTLGNSCFSQDYEGPALLETVVFEESNLQSIPQSCFSGNYRLISVTLPDSITSLGDYCFSDCSALESIEIPSSVTTIGSDCFKGCSALTSIEIPSSVTSIGGSCFQDCENLTTITINKPQDSIDGAPWDAPETTQIIWNG